MNLWKYLPCGDGCSQAGRWGGPLEELGASPKTEELEQGPEQRLDGREATERTYVWGKFTPPSRQCQHHDLTQLVSSPDGSVVHAGFYSKLKQKREFTGVPIGASRGSRAEESTVGRKTG